MVQSTIDNKENDHLVYVPQKSTKPAKLLHRVSDAIISTPTTKHLQNFADQAPALDKNQHSTDLNQDQPNRVGFVRKSLLHHEDVYSPLQLHEATVQLENTFNRSQNLTNLNDVSEYLIDMTADESHYDQLGHSGEVGQLEAIPKTSIVDASTIERNVSLDPKQIDQNLILQESSLNQQEKFLDEVRRKTLPAYQTSDQKVVPLMPETTIQSQTRLTPMKANNDFDPLFTQRSINKSPPQRATTLHYSPKAFKNQISKPENLGIAKAVDEVQVPLRKEKESSQPVVVENNQQDNPPVAKWLQDTDVKNHPYNFFTALQKKLFTVMRQKEQAKITMQRYYSQQNSSLPRNQQSVERNYDSSSFIQVGSNSTVDPQNELELSYTSSADASSINLSLAQVHLKGEKFLSI